MKKILVYFILLCSLGAGAQQKATITGPNTVGWVKGGLRVDSLSQVPRDTIMRTGWDKTLPAIAMKGDALYTWSVAQQKWLISSFGGTINGLNPVGGNTGQVLKKLSDNDYDYGWSNDNGGAGGGTTLAGMSDVSFSGLGTGQYLVYNGTAWVNASRQASDYSSFFPLTQRFLDSIAAVRAAIGTGISIDATPTDGSNNAVASNGVFDALALKANVSHVHSASDITSGTLSIARGGTGRSTIGTTGQLIRVDGAGTGLEYFTPSYQASLGYTPENVTNKVTSLASPNHTTYPTSQAVADAIANAGGGDMLKSTYDTDNDGDVDDAELLAGQNAAYYLNRVNHTGSQAISTITGLQSALDALQPLDGDLTAISAISSNGFLKRTGANTWVIDNNTYLQSGDLNGYATESWTNTNFYNKTQSDARYLQSYTETDPKSVSGFTLLSGSGTASKTYRITLADGTNHDLTVDDQTASGGTADGNNFPAGVTASNGSIVIARTGLSDISATASGNWNINAATVTNGVYTNGSYADPAWITALASSKITGLATVATTGSYNSLSNLPTLFDGNYNSLINLPTIPTNTNQLTNGAGFITDGNTGWDNSYGFITDGNTGWDNSYGFITSESDPKRVTSLAFSGASTKTLTLTLADGSTVANTFTDIEGSGGGGSFTINNNANNRILTATGTAGEANAEAYLTWTSSPYGLLSISDPADVAIQIAAANTDLRLFADANTGGINMVSNLPFVFATSNTTRLTIAGNGAMRFNHYGTGAHTGTAAKWLAVDASGNLIEENAPSGGGSGETNTASNLGGGLANYDSKSGVDLRFNSFASSDFDLASNVISLDASLKSNWNTAYGWGNHASVGYLTSLPAHNHNDLYYTEAEVSTLLASKQDALVSGTNIKTINGSSILGSGDLTISGGSAFTLNNNANNRILTATGTSGEANAESYLTWTSSAYGLLTIADPSDVEVAINGGTSDMRLFGSSSAGGINMISNLPLIFRTNNTNRLTIAANGTLAAASLAGNGSGIVAVDNSGNLSWMATPSGGGGSETDPQFDTKFAAKSTSNLTEGSNLYFTNARARAAISVTGNGSYDNATGVITINGSGGGSDGNNYHTAITASNGTIELTSSNGAPTINATASGSWNINAATATSVAWTGVSGRPTAVSAFTNDAGFITDGNTGWDNSYGFITSESDPKRVSSLAFSGTTTKTLTLTLADGTTVSNTFTDLEGSGGSASAPSTEILFGTGSGTSSSAFLTYNSGIRRLTAGTTSNNQNVESYFIGNIYHRDHTSSNTVRKSFFNQSDAMTMTSGVKNFSGAFGGTVIFSSSDISDGNDHNGYILEFSAFCQDAGTSDEVISGTYIIAVQPGGSLSTTNLFTSASQAGADFLITSDISGGVVTISAGSSTGDVSGTISYTIRKLGFPAG